VSSGGSILASAEAVVVNCELAIASSWPNKRRAELLPRPWLANQPREQQ
jgi:hypothetical protein